MKHDMMWAYMIHLSHNMWCDHKIDVTGASSYQSEVITDYATWRRTLEFLPHCGINTVLIDLGDAVQYETHPEIAIPGAWSKDKLREELDYIRSLGMTPLPKLNFSTCHDAWLGIYSRMVSTPQYYQVCKDLITEVAELFDSPAYFHLGMDEENPEDQKAFGLEFSVTRQGDLWWRDCHFLIDVCEKLGVRPWIWPDAFLSNPAEFVKKMPKSVLLSNWAYDPVARNPDGSYGNPRYQAYVELDKAGFDQVPTSSTWVWYANSQQTMELGKEHLAPERLKGYMTASWYSTTASSVYSLLNDAQRFGDAKKTVYPDF